MSMPERPAPALPVQIWSGEDGGSFGAPLDMADRGVGAEVDFIFQHFCEAFDPFIRAVEYQPSGPFK